MMIKFMTTLRIIRMNKTLIVTKRVQLYSMKITIMKKWKEHQKSLREKKRTGGNKRTAAKGNLFIDLNPAISNNNAMTLILNNEMKFKKKDNKYTQSFNYYIL